MKVRGSLIIRNTEPLPPIRRRYVAEVAPDPAPEPKMKLFTTATAKKFAEENVPSIVNETVSAIEREFGVKVPQRSRDAIAVNALASILARTEV